MNCYINKSNSYNILGGAYLKKIHKDVCKYTNLKNIIIFSILYSTIIILFIMFFKLLYNDNFIKRTGKGSKVEYYISINLQNFTKNPNNVIIWNREEEYRCQKNT